MKPRSKKILSVMTTLAIGAPIASADPAVPAPKLPTHWTQLELRTLGVVSIAIFDTALYLRTGANLLLAILVHLMANVCGGIALERIHRGLALSRRTR